MVDCCTDYAYRWKIKFNSEKSIYYTHDKTAINSKIKMDGKPLRREEEFVLDYPLVHATKSSYSLYRLGCHSYALSPFTVSFIYKQFCQSIYKYEMETLNLLL